MCSVGDDCLSKVCNVTCQAPTCSDGEANGTDCLSSMCYGSLCVASVNGCDAATATDMTGGAPTAVTFPNGNFTYAPKCLKVSVGTVVTFNGGFTSHPLQGGEVTAGNVEVPASSGPFVPATTIGTTADFTMFAAGTYPYYCIPRGTIGMNGVVFVVP